MAKEVNGAIEVLVGHGLADDQNPAYVDRVGKNHYLVRYSNEPAFTAALRNRPYAEAYRELRLARSYNILMLDGAMLQMVYEFEDGDLKRHRLAFLPSPDLLEYQNNPELYEEELLYADVVDKGVVAVPLRFDFDCRPEVAVPLEHPISHLTLGQSSRPPDSCLRRRDPANVCRLRASKLLSLRERDPPGRTAAACSPIPRMHRPGRASGGARQRTQPAIRRLTVRITGRIRLDGGADGDQQIGVDVPVLRGGAKQPVR